MPIPAEFTAFDVANAGVSVWTFKRSGGLGGAAPTFTGYWVATDDALDAELRSAIQDVLGKIEEVSPYGLLAQPHETAALTIGADETHMALIAAATANPLPQRRARRLKQIQNASFYVIKLNSNGENMYAIRKTDSSWRSKKRGGVIDAFFDDETLSLETRPAFTLSKHVDLLALGNCILIFSKPHFESVMSYREAHADDFATLQAEPDFAGLFTNIAPLVDFVGTNKIHLRRASAIRSKGHYRDPQFMARLRQHHAAYHLTVNFTAAGLIDPTPETCRDIITALLDHRLASAFSQVVYDVPDAVEVN